MIEQRSALTMRRLTVPALADRAILPTAWGSSYFFNRVGQ